MAGSGAGGVRVRLLERRDLRAARPVLRDAFADYPPYVALFPRRRARARLVATAMTATARDCLGAGEVVGAFDGDELVGIACWFAPGAFPAAAHHELRSLPRVLLALLLQPGRLGAALEAGRVIERNHPSGGQHWYLASIAVAPGHQGRGIGGRLLANRHRVLDREGRPAYLETASSANVAWYERNGYVQRGEGQAFRGGPTQWYLWRDPRGGVAPPDPKVARHRRGLRS